MSETRYDDKQNKRTQAYIRENYDQISVRVKKGRRELYKQKLAESGMSIWGIFVH